MINTSGSPQSIPDATTSSLADAWNWIKNGGTTAPSPGAGVPAYSAPPAPPADELLTWNTEDLAAASLRQFEADKIAQSKAIADAITAGGYNPEFLQTFTGSLQTALIAAAAIGGVVLILALVIGAKSR